MIVSLLEFAAVGLLGVAVAVASEQTATLHREIELSGEKLVEVKIEFGAGKLKLEKAQGKVLLDADLEYREGGARPTVEYSKDEGVGQLKLGMEGKDDGRRWKDSNNIWNLQLTDGVPLNFDIRMGASEAELDFSGMKVKRLNLETGASETKIRFNRRNKEVMDELKLAVGAAKLRVDGLGNANFGYMSFQGGVGTYTLDFTGDLKQEVQADISVGLGQLTLLIPKEVGAKIDASEAALCSFSVGGFQKQGKTYLNENYGKTEAELVIHLKCGLGSINIESVNNKGGD